MRLFAAIVLIHTVKLLQMKPPRSLLRDITRFGFLASLGVLPLPAVAQSCPFTPAEAVPDSLPAAGYYPLAVGNVWEYQGSSQPPDYFSSAMVGEEVVGDTLVDGQRHGKVRVRHYSLSGPDTLVVLSDRCCDYRAVDERGYLIYNLTVEGKRLGQPFNSCYMENGHTVAAYKGYPFQADSTVKGFVVAETGPEFSNGWGRIRSDVDALTFARVDGRTRGTPFAQGRVVVTSSENDPVASSLMRLRMWPNPVRSVLSVALPAEVPSGWTVRVYDALGRQVRTASASPFENRMRLPVGSLPPGAYFVQAETLGRIVDYAWVVVR